MFDFGRFTLLAWMLVVAWSASSRTAHHDLEVTLDPDAGTIEVVDRIRLSSPSLAREGFWLHAALEPRSDAGQALSPVAVDGNGARRFVTAATGGLTVRYRGRLAQRPPAGTEPAFWAGFANGHIGPEGVFLTGASGWYPRFDDASVTFDIAVTLPAGWRAVSQGRRGAEGGAGERVSRWQESNPQQEIVLVANRFTRYERPTGAAVAEAYLRTPDPALAARYLDATGRYLDLYAGLIGAYPYPKFALVENFWETGYGMPSFTLLGPRVVRLPFILHSSYPHEILHSWWGNGVYVDYERGNWSEGLTAYLADHLVQESRGRGAAYRRAALAKYRDWVDAGRDFPLRAFRGKHGAASEAVGYNKTLMFFHMLRDSLGDRVFVEALRRFYVEHRFAVAGYRDLRAAFEAASGRDLGVEFMQWIERPGAPRLEVDALRVEPAGEGYRLTGRVRQTQAGDPYRLEVPVAILLDGGVVHRKRLVMDARDLEFDLVLPGRPRRLAVDPGFDLFRRLDPAESPPALSALLGAAGPLAVLPSAAPPALRDAYLGLARRLGASEARDDDPAVALPTDRAVWLLGWENRHRATVAVPLAAQGVAFEARGVRLEGVARSREAECVVLAARSAAPVGWIGCDTLEAFAGLGRKLPHYGKYGYLAFAGAAPRNVAKGEWITTDSPLDVALDADAAGLAIRLAPRAPLARAPGR